MKAKPKKPAPKKVAIYAYINIFAPMTEAGEILALAQERGWETHTAMPFAKEGDTYRKGYSKPESTE